MKLLVLLVVLGLRRFEFSWPAALRESDRVGRAQALLANWLPSGLPGVALWGLRVALPAIVVGWLLCVLHGWLWGLVGWIAGALLLLWLLGPESEFRHLDDMLVRGRMNDPDALGELATRHFEAEGRPGDPGYFAELLIRIVHRDSGLLFATVFFLMALGYWAALLYLLNRWLARSEESGSEFARIVDAAMFWLPSRLLIVVMALVGDFRRVMDATDGRMLQLEDNWSVLEDA
ncbi:MAG: hypothetical protein CVV10_09985, partial [Gammaproteobacteria bacterium HGW-Gammaproteobacteria-14]